MPYVFLKYVHVTAASMVIGTGAVIVLITLMAHLKKDVASIARSSRMVALANLILTASIFAQPLTGVPLLRLAGITMSEGWMIAALTLYGLVGLLVLPNLWLQEKLTELAEAASTAGEALPQAYHRLFRLWSALGLFGFGAVLVILWLMIAKPSL